MTTSSTLPLNLQPLLDFERQHLWHPYASIGNPPPVNLATDAFGTHIRLADGTELIDAISSWWTMAHGHNHPHISQAIRSQAEHLCHVMFAGFTHQPAITLAQRLAQFLPPELDRIFLADSGSIAVECAAKMAVQYMYALGQPQRCRLLALKGGYHGDTAGAMALSDPDGMHTLFQGIMPHHLFAEQPTSPFDGPWNPDDSQSLERLLDQHHDTIAAVICEPIFQGGNAMWLYHPNYLRRLRHLCDQHGVLLILDEIATGFGRTGKLFAAHHADIVPDIMTVGKALTGGSITLAATCASRHVADVISSRGSGAFMHGPTYMGNPLACAAACASLELFQTGDWKPQTAAIERHLRDSLMPLKGTHNIRDVRCLGAIGVLEVEHMPTPAQVQQNVLDTHVWLRPFGNYIYTMPPFITPADELTRITDAMAQLAERAWENRNLPPAPPADPILDIHE